MRGSARNAVIFTGLFTAAKRRWCIRMITVAERTFQPFETEYISRGFLHVCGVDEAGRGPLAGDVYAAAVILP